MNENWVFEEDNLKINTDQWKPGNPLWVAGSSGDGKSTLAKKLASEHHAEVISSDIVLLRMCWSKEEFEKNLKEKTSDHMAAHKIDLKPSPALDYVLSHPDLPYSAKDPETKKVNESITLPHLLDFYHWLMTALRTNPKYKNKLYVIEGCAICHMDPEEMAEKPLIVLGGSRLHSLYQRAKRNTEEKNVPLLRSIFKYVKQYTIQSKALDDAKEAFRREVERARK